MSRAPPHNCLSYSSRGSRAGGGGTGLVHLSPTKQAWTNPKLQRVLSLKSTMLRTSGQCWLPENHPVSRVALTQFSSTLPFMVAHRCELGVGLSPLPCIGYTGKAGEGRGRDHPCPTLYPGNMDQTAGGGFMVGRKHHVGWSCQSICSCRS